MVREATSDTQRTWLLHIEACGNSGISMKAYAEKNGLDLQRFYFWKGRLKKLGVVEQQPGSKPVDGEHEVPTAAPRLRIQLSNGVSIEVQGDFDAAAMTALLDAARRF